MEIPATPLWPLPLITGSGVVILAAYVWSRRSIPGARILAAALACVAHWSFCGGLGDRSTSVAAREMWLHIEILGFSPLPVLCFLLTLVYIDRPLPRKPALALFLFPALAPVMHWTNAWHHLYFRNSWVESIGQFVTLGHEYGLGFWVFVAYSYALLTASVALIAHFWLKRPTQRPRTLVFLGSVALPWAANMLYVFRWSPFQYLDITPYAFVGTGLGMFWVLFRYRFQGIVPVAGTSVIESMSDGVVVIDIERRVAYLNPAAEALLNCRGADVLGRPYSEALGGYPDLVRFEESGHKVSGDVRLGIDDNDRVYGVHAVDVRKRERVVGRVLTLRDVTADRRASEQLEQARRAAEAAAVAKSRFLANMSHEIRTPMNGIVGSTELLLDAGLNTQQTELARTAHESAECLLAILNDILDYSKIEAGKMELERVAFRIEELVEQVVRVMRPAAAKKGLVMSANVSLEVPPVLMGDPTRLRQVLLNLVGNAVKFTELGGVGIEVAELSAGPRQTRLAITVVDTGIGIPTENIGKLFREFSQTDSSITRTHGGTGLGLAISSRIVSRMGGTIRVRSAVNRGSTFILEIPFLVAEARARLEALAQAQDDLEVPPGCRVLLTEDNPVNQRIGRKVLEKLGCVVEVADNGREAVTLACASKFDVILMDLQMPEIDGYQATRELHRCGIRTPVIALTASALDETRLACREAGMDDFITKPIRTSEVASVLRRYGSAPVVKPEPAVAH